MALKVTRAEVWVATIDDRPGGASEKLAPLAKAGAKLEFVFARRTPEQPGRGMVIADPLKGKKVVEAATAAGFAKPADMHSVRVEGGDKPGLGARMTQALAAAGISFRGLSAGVIGRKFVSFIALDTPEDAARAIGVLKKLA